MLDTNTSIADIKSIVREFVDQRDWQQFHSPKNLSMALAIEASELMEHFQWISMEDSRQVDADQLQKIGDEIADVFCYTIAMANSLDLDLASIFERKMERNRQKYPAAEYQGRFGPEDHGS